MTDECPSGAHLLHGETSLSDVTVSLPGQKTVCFVADVATVSDRGLDDENPIRTLQGFLTVSGGSYPSCPPRSARQKRINCMDEVSGLEACETG